jgi:hypothetical protein
MKRLIILYIIVMFLLASSGFGQELDDAKEIGKAKSKKTVGLILTIGGSAVFAGSMVLTFVDKKSVFTKYTAFYDPFTGTHISFPNFEKKFRTIYVVGDAVGLVTGIVGLILFFSGKKNLKNSEKGNNISARLRIGALPQYKGTGIIITLSF